MAWRGVHCRSVLGLGKKLVFAAEDVPGAKCGQNLMCLVTVPRPLLPSWAHGFVREHSGSPATTYPVLGEKEQLSLDN